MKKKMFACVLCLALAAGALFGCGREKITGEPGSERAESGNPGGAGAADGETSVTDGAGAADGEASVTGGAGAASGTENSGGAADHEAVNEGIWRAMEAAERLTTGSYFLIEDGSVLISGESLDGFAGDYAALQGVRKLADPSSETKVFALTGSGDLYYHQTRILSDVEDIVYSTTNTNQTAVCISGGKLYRVVVRDTADVNPDLRQKNPDSYIDVGSETVNYYEITWNFTDLAQEKTVRASGDFSRLSAEKSDFFLLNSDGQVFMDNNGGESEEYVGLECFGWDQLAVIDAAKYMLSGPKDSERQMELTVAGIQKDGTVLACGDYAEEILSWGPLWNITMEDGLIAGLTPEGSLKLAGPEAEAVESAVSGWTNLVGIKAGSVTGTLVLNGVDQDGNYYHLEKAPESEQASVTVVSPETGCGDGGSWYRYSPDGTVSRAGNSGWE